MLSVRAVELTNLLLTQNATEKFDRNSFEKSIFLFLEPGGYITPNTIYDGERFSTARGYISNVKSVNGVKSLGDVFLPPKPIEKVEMKSIINFKNNCDRFAFNSNDYWECQIKNFGDNLFHPVGTGKMGADIFEEQVIDRILKVLGIKVLPFIDPSILSKILSGKTNVPTETIAKAASDLLNAIRNRFITYGK